MRRFVHHSAAAHWLVVAFIEKPIEAHGAHVHIGKLGPAEELAVEVESAVEIGGVELVPADGAGRGGLGALRRGHGRVGSEDHEGCSLRVGQDGEAKHSGNVGGGSPQFAAGFTFTIKN